ncbi:MAG: hypothetical protein EXQ49_08150 [Acidobacteria bacterium]|nr:hypothetical protein [Acidobacteriota bacterium]
MPTPPDVRVRALLALVARRLGLQAAERALALGAALALVPFLFTRHLGLTIGVAAIAAVAYFWATRGARADSAALIEAKAPQCRNVLVTAEALLEGKLAASPAVYAVVIDDAARQADGIAPAALWPWWRSAVALAAAALLWTLVAFLPAERIAGLAPGEVIASSAPVVEQVEVVVTPPPYTRRTAETLRNPERISVLIGSSVRVQVTSPAAAVTIESSGGSQHVTRGDSAVFAGDVVVESDGYLAITPVDSGGAPGPRRLIGVTAVVDRAPEVRVTEPAKDLYLKDGNTRITVRLQAGDDMALQSLRLAYTKVAGAGESFTFTEGEVPVTVTRTNDREWTAVGLLALDTMALDIGDMVVYRGVVRDGRPGAPAVESDAFFVEIVSASDAMAEGFSIDDRQDKYALSQQMVIIKTERLIARAPSFSRDALIDDAMTIAAEQRSVRAEIMFMMGGEFEDEFVEAEHEHEVTDGRFDNTGRADLALATRSMSRAATQLTEGDLKAALASERVALAAMQRALSRRRFILRTRTERNRIDTARRLQGKLADLGQGTRSVEPAETSTLVEAVRAALLAVTDVSRATTLTAAHADLLSNAAARLLVADGRGAPVVDIASRLSAAAEAIAAANAESARRSLGDAAARLTAVASAELAAAPLAVPNATRARLLGALADALRSGGGR